MYSKIKRTVKEITSNKKVTRTIYFITLAASLLILVLVLKGPEQKGSLLSDDDGNIVGIKRRSLATSERYDVRLLVQDEEESSERDLTITLRSLQVNDVSKDKGTDTGISRDAEISAEIDNMLTEIEYSDEEVITLPSSLPDGTPVRWSAAKQADRSGIALIPVIYIALIIVVIKSGLDSGKDEEAAMRKEIMRSLPRFCNQLFLMMNAGMILSDAFERICSSYSSYGDSAMNRFERDLTEICSQNTDHRVSTASLISEYASQHNVKELVRIAAILTENEKRGSDVVENLSRESKYLWDERKIIARESGKMIDTKMSLPLAMLLMLLIVITMAPTLMNI